MIDRPDKSYLDALQRAIRETHGCTSVYDSTVPVIEVFQGKIAWEGDVEVFSVFGHKKARRAYAWGATNNKGGWDVTAVLELPPVDSAQTAVKVAIAAHARGVVPQPTHKP